MGEGRKLKEMKGCLKEEIADPNLHVGFIFLQMLNFFLCTKARDPSIYQPIHLFIITFSHGICERLLRFYKIGFSNKLYF